jgi:hypothetical protein
MNYDRYFENALCRLKDERHHRVFADLKRLAGRFPHAIWHSSRGRLELAKMMGLQHELVANLERLGMIAAIEGDLTLACSATASTITRIRGRCPVAAPWLSMIGSKRSCMRGCHRVSSSA